MLERISLKPTFRLSKGIFTYQYKKDEIPVFVELPVERVKEIIELNKKGIKPETLEGEVTETEFEQMPDYENVVGQESLTRFDKKKKKKKKNKSNNAPQLGANQQNKSEQNENKVDEPSAKSNEQQPKQNNQVNQQNGGGQNRNNHHRHKHNNRPNNQPRQQNDGNKNA